MSILTRPSGININPIGFVYGVEWLHHGGVGSMVEVPINSAWTVDEIHDAVAASVRQEAISAGLTIAPDELVVIIGGVIKVG